LDRNPTVCGPGWDEVISGSRPGQFNHETITPRSVLRNTLYAIRYTHITGGVKTMATQAQILANRRNALKSTGPKSPRGRNAVSKNAASHGLLAHCNVIDSEDQAEFNLHRAKLLDELAPQTPMESILAERIINLTWRLKRSSQIQNQTIDALKNPKKSDPLIEKLKKRFNLNQFDSAQESQNQSHELSLGRLAIKDFSNARVLERLLMYERRIENSLYKTLIEFQRLTLIRELNNGSANPLKRLTIHQPSL
jgi:hypothetical protein